MRLRRFALVLLLTNSLVAAQAQVPAAQRTAALTGSVVRAGTNTPVGGARIVAARVGGPIDQYRTITADDVGRFAIRDLSAGTYRVFAEHENYLQAEYGRRLVGATGTPITLAHGQTAAPIVVAMTPPGAIAGRVFDRGRPARSIWVRALKPTFLDGRRYVSVAALAETDDRGEFRLFGLQPGTYFVSAVPFAKARIVGDNQVAWVIPTSANGNSSTVTAPLSPEIFDPETLDPFVYPAVYHPGTTDFASALPIDVRAGETASGIALMVARASTFRIRGRVAGVEGQAPPALRVALSPMHEGTNLGLPSFESKDGAFELKGVPPGRYYVSAQSQSPSPIRMAAVATVDIVDRDLNDVVLTLQAGVTVTGTVLLDGRVPTAADGQILVQLLGGPAGLGGGAGAQHLQPDGTFSVPNMISGPYTFRTIQTGRPFWIKSARFGADDVTIAPMRADAELHGRQLEIALSSRTAAIDVEVSDRDGRPVAGALIVAVPDAARQGRSSLFKTATTDASGRAKLADMAPGEYTLFGTTDIEAAAWQDPAVLRAFDARSQVVRLAEGGAAVIRLRILQ